MAAIRTLSVRPEFFFVLRAKNFTNFALFIPRFVKKPLKLVKLNYNETAFSWFQVWEF